MTTCASQDHPAVLCGGELFPTTLLLRLALFGGGFLGYHGTVEYLAAVVTRSPSSRTIAPANAPHIVSRLPAER